MNGKEKFMFVMLLALYIGAFYYYAMTEELKIRMDELNLADKEHVDKVLGSYSDSLHTVSYYTSPSPRDLSTSRMPSSA